MKRTVYMFYFLVVFFFQNCNYTEDKKLEYPDTIQKLKLQSYYDRAQFDLYKLNSVFSPSEFIIKEDSIPCIAIIKKRGYNASVFRDEKKLKELFGEKVRKYVEFELEWIEEDSASIITGPNEITLTFFPKASQNHYYFKYGNVHTITYLNDTLKSIVEGDLAFMQFPNKRLIQLDSKFEKYLSENKTILNPWLDKFIKKKDNILKHQNTPN